MNSNRFSITLTPEQADVLRRYAKSRWMYPRDILRMALDRYMSTKSFPRPITKEGDESSGKIDYANFGELFRGTPQPDGASFVERTEKKAFWTLMRAKVFRRDGYHCRSCGCGSDKGLHVHHIIRRKEGGADVEENLITLCAKCHSNVHNSVEIARWWKEGAVGPVEIALSEDA